MVRSLSDLIKGAVQKLPDIESPAFGPLFDTFAQSRVVLIGDASHGTSEFYRARAAITKRLITQHGFNIVAIEGDWPDARAIDRYVRQSPTPKALADMPIFNHFPRWMWRNTEVQGFVDWLRKHNAQLKPEQRAGVYGLDLYSMKASIHSVVDYLDRKDPEAAKVARSRYQCLEPWVENPSKYGRMALSKGYAPCEEGVVKMLRELLAKRMELAAKDGEDFIDAEMNARVVKDSERYYRSMYYADEHSWNLRDTHMFDTLQRLMKLKPGSKAVVWAHNSHVGDARHTGMSKRGELNIGQLCRQHWSGPNEVTIIGCSTHGGDGSTVAAANEWDTPEQIMPVRASMEGSYERVMHETGIPSFLLDLRSGHQSEEVRQSLMKPRLQRFIGVIYRPATERWSHYVETVLPKQMDALVWFDKSTAVNAFEKAQPDEPLSVEDTYPFGL